MDTFGSRAKNDELIGVHCTHGINRTGYLICRYLVQQLGWDPQRSVKAFEKARGYPIERAAYVMEIMKSPHVKFDVTSINLEQTNGPYNEFTRFNPRRPPMRQSPMPSKFNPRQRGFVNGRAPPYPFPQRQPFGYGGPPHAFGPRPPIPPPHVPPTGRMYGPRPHAYGMPPMRPPLPPSFPGARFPPRMPGPPCIPGSPRLPHSPLGPPSRLSGPGMPPPRLPPPGMIPPRLPPPRMAPPRHPLPGIPSPRLPNVRRSIQGHGPPTPSLRGPAAVPSQPPKIFKDVDFTLDTFDENLATSVCP